MELALKEILVIKEDIEPPQHYAVKIKDLDNYYGYLAWAEIYFKQRNQWDKAIAVLKELVRIEPTRPEAYIRLWLWHYRSMKTYEPAEDIIEQAFIKATDNETPIYRVLIYLMYAKTLFKRTKIRNALELLQRQYLEHPTYPIFLYHYGKMCAKSEITKFAGIASDTLSECLRVCASDYHGGVWYWLFKAYLTARLPLDALLAAKSAVSKLHSEERKKIRFINEFMHKHKEVLIAYDKLLVLLKSPISQDKYDEVLNLCRIVKDFDPANGDYIQAKVFWKIGAQDKALKYLQERSDSTTPFLLKAHLALVSYLIKSKCFMRAKVECQKLITKTKNPSVPTFIWMKAHIKYAKTLSKCDSVHKAINILKCIAKVLPPVSNHEIVYTKVLQQVKNIEDLEEAHLQTALSKDVQYEYNTYRTSMADIFYEDYLQAINFMNKSPFEEQIDITSQVMTYETPGNEPEFSPQKRGIQTFRDVLKSGREPEKYAALTIETEFDEEDPENLQSSRYLSPESLKAFQGLSCCSDPTFLYKLGKYSAKYNCRAEDGLYALHDYKILLKFQLNISNDKRELQEAKSQFWECMIKKNDNQLSGSESFLPDLVSKLQTMGLTSKHTALTSSITKSVSKTSLE
jgi:tetratricopeptide (TPR) repeat protein